MKTEASVTLLYKYICNLKTRTKKENLDSGGWHQNEINALYTY